MGRAVADAQRVGEKEGVHLDHRQPAAADLRRHLRLEPVEDGQFLDLHPVEPPQVGGGNLKKVKWSPSKSCATVKPRAAAGSWPVACSTSISRST